MSLKVKICGVTNPEDARAAVDAGADMVGLMFYPPSPRHVELPTATAIAAAIPEHVLKVGVFVNPTEFLVRQTAEDCKLNALQFHGNETPEFCRQFAPLKIFKAFRIRDRSSLAEIPAYKTTCWLLDSHVAGQPGGTGERFNWNFAVEVKSMGRPIILAGGLTPDNVASAVRQVRPYAVDVSSGVESAPGKKDSARILEFIRAARGA